MEVGLPGGFLVGLIVGGILGLIVGFLLGMASGPKERRLTKRKNEAERLLALAKQENNQKRKLKLLGEILDKYPHSEWAEKALNEAMEIRKRKTQQ